MAYNAKGDSLTRKDIINFIQKYNCKNGVTPRLKDWIQKNGFPCNKEFIVNKFGKYNDLIIDAGFETFSYGKIRFCKKKMLEDLRNAIVDSRSVDIEILSKKYETIRHRRTYVDRFGSYDNALKEAGIMNEHITLIRLYREYKLEDPVSFLKAKYGINNEFTEVQKELIDSIVLAKNITSDVRRETLKEHISLHKCKTLFPSFTVAVIASGLSPAAKYAKVIANDGHSCDSYEELLIDNWLYSNNFTHDVHVLYPNSKYKCDFKIGDTFIEYTGYTKINSEYLRGQYFKRLELKKEIANNYKIKLIIIEDVSESSKKKLAEALSSNV